MGTADVFNNTNEVGDKTEQPRSSIIVKKILLLLLIDLAKNLQDYFNNINPADQQVINL